MSLNNTLSASEKQAEEEVARSLPSALGPEKSLLSSMLQEPMEYIGRAQVQNLTAEHFYSPAHQVLFRLLDELANSGAEVELISLTQTLMDRGQLEKIGGPAALTEIYTYAPTAAHFDHHLSIVKDKYVLRNIISSSTNAITRSFEDPEEVAALLDEVEQAILAIREGAETEQATNVKEDVRKVLDNLEKMLANKGQATGVKSGYTLLDKMSNGLKPGEMFVIAARPSMGKTSFVMNIIENVCLDSKLPSMFFSCEMTSEQIVERLLFARARFIKNKIRDGFAPTKADLSSIKNAATEVACSKLFIDDTAGISISELRAKARRKKREEDIQLIAVDYLQLMKSNSKQAQNSREREVAEISSGLKALAKELGVPIIVLAQLNRGPEGRTGGKPRMSDLRESGSIEQDADMIGLLFRTAYYADNEEDRESMDGIAELTLAKNRNGSTGSIPLRFHKELMLFENGSQEMVHD